MKSRIVYLLVCVLTLGVAACNVFDGLYDEGSGTAPKGLLADARVALEDGRIDDAVAHLRKAHEVQPTHIEVRVELASALLAQHGIDVMLIKDIADEVKAEAESASKRAGCPDEASCHFDCAAAKSFTPFDYQESAAYVRLQESIAVLQEVEVLVSVPLEDLGAEPGHRFDTKAEREQLYGALVAKIEETDSDASAHDIAGSLLLNAAISRLATTLADVEESAAESEITLYHVERMDGTVFVDYCGEEIDAFVAGTMCPASTSAHFALDLLETRLENFAGDRGSQVATIAGKLVEAGHELFDGLSSEIEAECNS